MSTTHTQGEWAFDDNEIYSERTDHGAAICTMNTTSAHFTEEEVKANARLIAAAPDLLEIASEIMEEIHQKHIDAKNGIVVNSYTWHKLNSAIQKATQP
jgi:hypothetical protein